MLTKEVRASPLTPILVKMQKNNNNIYKKGDQNGGSKRIDETGET